MDEEVLKQSEIFHGITSDERKELLTCLGAYRRSYQKGELIFRMGEETQVLGIVLSGAVNIEKDDIWGNESILSHVEPGEVFGETYACVPGERLMVNVVAAEPAEILFLDVNHVLKTCPNACGFHQQLVHNLVNVMASKNLALTRKISHTAPKTIRGRLMSYLSYQVLRQGSFELELPFDRQQLADYLVVDRSAMSAELGKMKADGLLEYRKNRFLIRREHREEFGE